MQDIISIKEMAELRKISTETLRHYDRIGLFKPVHVDSETNYRYYSLLQYEKLGTIVELRKLGLSLNEIKDYFKGRNVKNSLELLIKQQSQINEKLEALNQLHCELEKKIEFTKKLMTVEMTDEIRIKTIPSRTYLTFYDKINNELELSYVAVNLEKQLDQKNATLPVFASDRYAGIIAQSDIEEENRPLSAKLVIECLSDAEKKSGHIIKVPEGKFACIYYVGTFWKRGPTIKKLLEYMNENDLELAGDILQVQWVDFSITDNLEEISYEFQAPVRSK